MFALPSRHPHLSLDAVWGYLAEVTDALGVGLESCTVDHDTPVTAYVALDEEFRAHPGCDTALVWNETHGWAAAIENHSDGELVVIRYLGGDTIAPPADRVSRFITALREGDEVTGRLRRPSLRTPTGPADLEIVLRQRTKASW
ncbi:DUF6292 family protein [Amycolatopsis umgeniensis]|nr:DUF6292 family protein [Amycolatopsis umgeniensis]